MSATPQAGPTRPVTTSTFRANKAAGRRIAMVTAYDVSQGRLADAAGVDAILVGDSLGMVMLGYDSTLPVTMEDMLHHTAAVVRGVTRALVIADMPFLSFQVSPEEALRNAGRLMAEGGAGAVKLEGGVSVAPTVTRLTDAGGYKVQAKESAPAITLLDDCLALQEAGAFGIVLECIPAELAELASAELDIPTIGIGAGAGCDGEVQVWHDMLGLGGDFTPRHAKHFAEAGAVIASALADYVSEVREGAFPGEEQCTHMDPRALDEVRAARRDRGTGTKE